MLTIELRVNGQLVRCITAMRTGTLMIDSNVGEYKVHTYDLETQQVRTKTLHHIYSKGITALAKDCLK